MLFLLYVNDIPDWVASTAKLFADDTKIYRRINSMEDCRALQRDLNRLTAWSNLWLLRFNAAKCIFLRLREHFKYRYSLDGVYLEEESVQRDLGVMVSNNLKPAKHIETITKKASQRIGMIWRCFTGLTREKITTLYTTIVRPILEYASTTWSPWLKKDIETLEKVQRRCLRMCTDADLQFDRLETRRQRTDLAETYKFMNSEYRTDSTRLFQRPARTLRGHDMKLHHTYSRTDVRKYFFAQRVVAPWNSLPDEVIHASSTRDFRRRVRALPQD